jgi:hypothetical protein
LDFIMHILDADSNFLEHSLALGSIVIPTLAHHSHNATIYYHHGAGSARCHAAIERRAIYCHTPSRRLAYGVLLGMDCPHTVLGNASVLMDEFLELMPDIVAVGQA